MSARTSPPLIRSSAARLALLYVGVLIVGVSALLSLIYLATRQVMEQNVDRVIQAEAELLQDEYDDGGINQLVSVLNRRVGDWGRIGAVYMLTDPQGHRLAGNLTNWPPVARNYGEWLEFELSAREGDDEVAHPVRAHAYTLDGNRLLVGSDTSGRQSYYVQLRRASFWAIGLTTLLSAIVGWGYIRRVGERVRGVAAACNRIMSGDLTRRLPRDGTNDEFDQLSGTVNRMLDRVEHQTNVLRTTFGSAAHDLRTPLHRMRTRLEMSLQPGQTAGAMRGPVLETVADLDRVQRTLATLLQIANAEAGVGEGHMQRLDLGELVRELGELYAPAARDRSITLAVDAPTGAVLLGSRQLLAQLFANLVENALKYAPAGGRIDVLVGPGTQFVRLRVGDNGPGIPGERRDEALLPFRRLDPDDPNSGSGLGLSLVAAVVRLHRGELRLADNGPGLVVECRFPALGNPPARPTA